MADAPEGKDDAVSSPGPNSSEDSAQKSLSEIDPERRSVSSWRHSARTLRRAAEKLLQRTPIGRVIQVEQELENAYHLYQGIQEWRAERREEQEHRERQPYHKIAETKRQAYIEREMRQGHERDHEGIYRAGRIRDNEKDIREVLSKRGDDPFHKIDARERFQQADSVRKQVEAKDYIPANTKEHYQYLLSRFSEQHPPSSFDRVYYPDRALEVDRKLSNQLYVLGHEPAAIRHAIRDASPQVTGLQGDRQAMDTNVLNPYLNEVMQDISPRLVSLTASLEDKREPSLAEQRLAIMQWRQEHQIPLYDRRSREDYQKAQQSMERHELIHQEAWAVFSAPDPPDYRGEASREYAKELAPRLIHQGIDPVAGTYERQFETDKHIAMQLRLAGYEYQDISSAMNQVSSNAHDNERYGEKIIQSFMHDDNFTQEYESKRSEFIFKELGDERRLNQLGLDYLSKQAGETDSEQERAIEPSR